MPCRRSRAPTTGARSGAESGAGRGRDRAEAFVQAVAQVRRLMAPGAAFRTLSKRENLRCQKIRKVGDAGRLLRKCDTSGLIGRPELLPSTWRSLVMISSGLSLFTAASVHATKVDASGCSIRSVDASHCSGPPDRLGNPTPDSGGAIGGGGACPPARRGSARSRRTGLWRL